MNSVLLYSGHLGVYRHKAHLKLRMEQCNHRDGTVWIKVKVKGKYLQSM